MLMPSALLSLPALSKVDLPKPLGLRFARGSDGGAYIVANDPKLGNTDPRIQVRAGRGEWPNTRLAVMRSSLHSMSTAVTCLTWQLHLAYRTTSRGLVKPPSMTWLSRCLDTLFLRCAALHPNKDGAQLVSVCVA